MIPKVCKGCQKRFVANIQQQYYCGRCGDKQHATYSNPDFIGVDGEGVTRPDGSHEYILLSVGNRSLFFDDGRRLTFYEIIPFLWDCFIDNPDATYVGFYLGYDFTHWLRDLPENRARMLLTNEGIALRRRSKSGGNHLPFPVEHRGWNFDMLGMKRFRLWKDGDNRRMYICDTGSYFQTSFLNAIDPKKWPDGPILSDDEFKKISTGKSERGLETVAWGTPIDPEMLEYNILENDVLARLMKRYNEGLEHVGLSLKRDQWFGPGQAAQTWLNGVKAPTRTEFADTVSVEIRDKLRSSYYGGWFEIFAHGHIPGESWSYDINSAYPDIQSTLPCCLHGMWRQDTTHRYLGIHNPDTASHRFTLAYCTVTGSHDYMGSLLFRLPTGHILRPQKTKGWYWLHEIHAGISAGIIDHVEIEETIEYVPCDCKPPFGNLRSLYNDRIRIGKNTSGGKARKLIYNSTYGKTAQSIGAAKYANPFYASLITSYCRTYLLNAIAVHPFGADDVLMVATDGIAFRRRNPNLQLSEETLGMWSEARQENLTLFMPGVYWDDNTRLKLKEGQHPTLKSRGVPGKTLGKKVMEIDEQFRDSYSGRGFPICDIPISFSMVSPKQALARNKWETCGHIIHDSIRTINSDPVMKRLPVTEMKDGIIRSFCYETAPGGFLESMPYTRLFGDKELEEILTPDGPADMLFHHGLEQS